MNLRRAPEDAATEALFSARFRRMKQDRSGRLRFASVQPDEPSIRLGRWDAGRWRVEDVRLVGTAVERCWALLKPQDVCWGADDRAFFLDREGGLWEQEGPQWRRLAEPRGGPGSSGYSDRRLGWDPRRDRLVVFGGAFENASWVCDRARPCWTELTKTPRPHPGAGAGMTTTSEGMFLLQRDELWLLDGESWSCRAHLDRSIDVRDIEQHSLAHNSWLWYVPGRELLVTLVPESSSLLAWTPAGWSAIDLALPPAVLADDGRCWGALDSDWSGTARVLIGLDAPSETLVVCDQSGTWTSALDAARAIRSAWPTAAIEPRNTLTSLDRRVPAVALVETDIETDIEAPLTDEEWSLLPEGLRPPFTDYAPKVIVPYRPEMGCRRSFAALFVAQDVSGQRTAPPRSPLRRRGAGLDELTVLLRPRWERPDPVVLHGFGWRGREVTFETRRLGWAPFDDLSPEDLFRCHSPPGRAVHLSQDDKVGGFEGRSFYELDELGPPPRIALQLRRHVHVGDVDLLVINLWDAGTKVGGEFFIRR